MTQRVSIVIPAYNEADTIKATVRAALSIPEVDEVLVVDDHSGDGTAEAARAAGARVFSLPRNSGKGAALNYGIRQAIGEVVVLLDADLGVSAAQARKLVLPILAGEADVSIARFPRARRKGGFGLVKGLARNGIRYFTGLEMQSPISGQRALRREALEKLVPLAGGYGVEVGMTVDAARFGYRLIEVPVEMTHKETGRDVRGFLHRGRQFRDIAFTLLKCYVKYYGKNHSRMVR
ncbi:MAG: glycosyltransferase family 2 protein [Clostridia bacterium]|nr:glycosyltransferase family 2 protein [Clostridia bacterium]MDQ7791961.1 glycosyltransferase family 2 protein [Clostridia bacterium]